MASAALVALPAQRRILAPKVIPPRILEPVEEVHQGEPLATTVEAGALATSRLQLQRKKPKASSTRRWRLPTS